MYHRMSSIPACFEYVVYYNYMCSFAPHVIGSLYDIVISRKLCIALSLEDIFMLVTVYSTPQFIHFHVDSVHPPSSHSLHTNIPPPRSFLLLIQ